MDDPRDLRDQAEQWRRQARTQTPAVAAALTLAAHELDEQAARFEAARRPPPRAAYPSDGARETA